MTEARQSYLDNNIHSHLYDIRTCMSVSLPFMWVIMRALDFTPSVISSSLLCGIQWHAGFAQSVY